nr:MAG TPA: hypothetical protein [Caudoviricetes sp.]
MSKYALNLDEDGRILSATYETYAAPGMPIVEALPDGDITDYKYINGEFIYEPLPEPIQPQEPTTEDIINALLGIKGE